MVPIGIRAKMEHSFRLINRRFGFVKTHYRWLKSSAQLVTQFPLYYLWKGRGKLIKVRGRVRLKTRKGTLERMKVINKPGTPPIRLNIQTEIPLNQNLRPTITRRGGLIRTSLTLIKEVGDDVCGQARVQMIRICKIDENLISMTLMAKIATTESYQKRG